MHTSQTAFSVQLLWMHTRSSGITKAMQNRINALIANFSQMESRLSNQGSTKKRNRD